MSLYQYKVTLVGGAEKEGKITAKTEQAAREKLTSSHEILNWHSITESPPKPPSKPKTAKSATKPAAVTVPGVTRDSAVAIKGKLDKLLFRQNGKCFFCGKKLAKAEASIEHLLAVSRGGDSKDDNLVACCLTLNQVLSDMPLKEKFRLVLEKAKPFVCPTAKID